MKIKAQIVCHSIMRFDLLDLLPIFYFIIIFLFVLKKWLLNLYQILNFLLVTLIT